MISVSINNEAQQLAAGSSVTELLAQLQYGSEYGGGKIAVAINSEFVPRASYPQRLLSDGDCVDIVAAMQGG